MRYTIQGLWLAGLAGALGIGLLVLAPSLFDNADSGHKTLELTDQDIDPETTTVAKTLLKQNQISRNVAPALLIDARAKLLGNDLLEAEKALRLGQLSPVLAPLAKSLADDLERGKAAAFTIWVEPDDEAQGQAVEIQLDGVDLGKFDVSNDRYAITLIRRTGSTSRIQLTCANEHSTVFKAETASSEARTRRLRMGKSDFWELIVR